MPTESGLDFYPPLAVSELGAWRRFLVAVRLRFRNDKRMVQRDDGSLAFYLYADEGAVGDSSDEDDEFSDNDDDDDDSSTGEKACPLGRTGYPDITLPVDGLAFRRIEQYTCLSHTPYYLPSGKIVKGGPDSDDDFDDWNDERDDLDLGYFQREKKRARRDAERARKEDERMMEHQRRFQIIQSIHVGIVTELAAVFGKARVVEWDDGGDLQIYAGAEVHDPSPPCAACKRGQSRSHVSDRHEAPPPTLICDSCCKGELLAAAEIVVRHHLPAGTSKLLAAYFWSAPPPCRTPLKTAAARAPEPLCHFYLTDSCHFGSRCRNSHDRKEHSRFAALQCKAAARASARAAGDDLSSTDEDEATESGDGTQLVAFRNWRKHVFWQRRARRLWRTAQMAAAAALEAVA
jgi:hypothetical protein